VLSVQNEINVDNCDDIAQAQADQKLAFQFDYFLSYSLIVVKYCNHSIVHRLGSNNVARKMFETRSNLANYFLTDEGAVTGQEKYVTQGAKRVQIY
jgi:hypothetical protein